MPNFLRQINGVFVTAIALLIARAFMRGWLHDTMKLGEMADEMRKEEKSNGHQG